MQIHPMAEFDQTSRGGGRSAAPGRGLSPDDPGASDSRRRHRDEMAEDKSWRAALDGSPEAVTNLHHHPERVGETDPLVALPPTSSPAPSRDPDGSGLHLAVASITPDQSAASGPGGPLARPNPVGQGGVSAMPELAPNAVVSADTWRAENLISPHERAGRAKDVAPPLRSATAGQVNGGEAEMRADVLVKPRGGEGSDLAAFSRSGEEVPGRHQTAFAQSATTGAPPLPTTGAKTPGPAETSQSGKPGAAAIGGETRVMPDMPASPRGGDRSDLGNIRRSAEVVAGTRPTSVAQLAAPAASPLPTADARSPNPDALDDLPASSGPLPTIAGAQVGGIGADGGSAAPPAKVLIPLAEPSERSRLPGSADPVAEADRLPHLHRMGHPAILAQPATQGPHDAAPLHHGVTVPKIGENVVRLRASAEQVQARVAAPDAVPGSPAPRSPQPGLFAPIAGARDPILTAAHAPAQQGIQPDLGQPGPDLAPAGDPPHPLNPVPAPARNGAESHAALNRPDIGQEATLTTDGDGPLALAADLPGASGPGLIQGPPVTALPDPVPPDQQEAPLLSRIPDIANQMARSLPATSQPDSTPVELVLSPAELGTVRMVMHTDGDKVSLTIAADRADTHEMLRRHGDLLVEELRSSGFSNISFDFAQSQRHSRQQPQPQPVPTAVALAYGAPRQPLDDPALPRPPVGLADAGLDLRL